MEPKGQGTKRRALEDLDEVIPAESKRNKTEDDIIELNVGSKRFSTLKSTLCKIPGTWFYETFHDKRKIEALPHGLDGKPFLDRNPKLFALCLNYLRSGKWHIPKKAKNLAEIEAEIKFYGLYDVYLQTVNNCTYFEDSNILSESMQDLLNNWYGIQDQCWKLIYRATRDGWRAQDFHYYCNSRGPTMSVVKVSNFVFGGLNPSEWKSSGEYLHNPDTWLFSLSNPENIPVKIVLQDGGQQFSIYDSADYGPTFGGGHDLCIQNNANQTSQNYSNLGYSFRLPEKVPRTSCYFTGHCYFTPDDIEVFVPENFEERL